MQKRMAYVDGNMIALYFNSHRQISKLTEAVGEAKAAGNAEATAEAKVICNAAPTGFLIDLLMPPDQAEERLVNILRRYDCWVGKYGAGRAGFIFHTQCIGAIVSFWMDWLLRRLKLIEFLWRRSP
jgi:hypothetical protein